MPAASHRRLWRLAAPIILSNLTVPLLGAVDTAVAGHLQNASYLAGVALGGMVFTIMLWGLGFLRMGTTGLAAQAEGAGDGATLRLILWRGLIVAVLLGLALILLQRPILWLMRHAIETSAGIASIAELYVRVRIWSVPAALGNFVVLGWLLGRQQVRLGLALQVLINGLNAVLAIAFVFGLGWGVAGIAGATALADVAGLATGLLLAHRRLDRPATAPRWREIAAPSALRRLIAINRDIFLRTACLLGAFAYFAARGAREGDVLFAANALLLNFQSFTSYGLDGIAQAAEALIGAAIGAGDRTAYRSAARLSLVWAFAAACAFALTYLAFGQGFIAILSDLPEIRDTAVRYLPWVVLSPLVSVWSFQLDGIFIGATRTRELRNGMAASLLVFLLGVHLLQPMFGNHGLWAALMVFMAARACTLALYLPRIERHISSAPAGRSAAQSR